MDKFYIATAIAYVNAGPHIGHALEFVQADALARFYRLKGVDAFYLTGTDEHGVKIYETSQKANMETQEFVDMNAAKFKDLEGTLNLSNNDFIRTTSERHKKGVKEIWERLYEKGDIYKGTYEGNYCVGCEAYIPDKDLVDGKCPTHKKEPKVLSEENYFFKLSKYSDAIKKAIETDELKVIPESRKNEILNIIGEDGLKDVSFSRPKSALPWGVTVPNDESQVMYVWCDALSNYITGIGFNDDMANFEKYWPCNAHIIGKDILRFHAGIWIGMLMAAEIPIPTGIYVHGFITSEGQKMSKSLGNVVDPLEYVEKYGTDALRYYLLREIPTTDDGDFSHGRFLEVFNSELANGIGNFVNRVLMMTEKYFDSKVPANGGGLEILDELNGMLEKYKKYFEAYDIKKACEVAFDVVNLGNKYIDDKKPWAMAKEGDEGLAQVMYNLNEILRYAVTLFVPFVPQSVEKICEQAGLNVEELNLNLEWGGVKEGTQVKPAGAVFPRLEE